MSGNSVGSVDLYFALARAFAGSGSETKTGSPRLNIIQGLAKLVPVIAQVLTAATPLGPLGIAMHLFSGVQGALDVASNPPSSKDNLQT